MTPLVAAPLAVGESSSQARRFLLLFALSVAEYLPISLLSTTLPVLLRRAGASLDDIGALTIAWFPWALKFLWAPLVDRFGQSRFGRYRTWLVALLPVVAMMVTVMAFFDLEAMVTTDRALGLAFLTSLTVVCATIDTASHGLAVVLLAPSERGLGNGLQTAGQMTGHLVGGGLAVWTTGTFGWKATCLGMACCYALPIVAALAVKEPLGEHRAPGLGDFLAVAKRPGNPRWLFWLALFGIAYGLFGVPYQTALVDAGLDLTEIGVIQGLLMGVMGIVGGLFAGAVARRWSRRASLFGLCGLFGVLLVPSVLAFSVFAQARWALYVGLGAAFTVQYSVLQVTGFLAWGLGAVLAQRAGYVGTFVVSMGLVAFLLALASRLFDAQAFAVPSHPETSP
jgi:MFS family permease